MNISRNIKRASVILILCFLVACGRPVSVERPLAPINSLLVVGVSIVDPEAESVSLPQDILVVEGRIAEIAKSGSIDPKRADETRQANGFFAIAGFIDVHAHVGDGGIAKHQLEDREAALTQFVRYGVTTIFVPGGGGGNDDDLKGWKKRQASGDLMAPGIYGSGALITAPGSHPIGTIWELGMDADPETLYRKGAIALAEDQPVGAVLDAKVAKGVDAIKIVIEDGPGPWYPKPRLSNTKVSELVHGAHDRGLRVFAHISTAAHVRDAVAAGVDGIMHSADDSIADEVLVQMARHNIFYVSTLSLFDGFFKQALGDFEPEPYALAGVSQKAIKSLESEAWRSQAVDPPDWVEPTKQAVADNLLRAERHGVPLALGSDVNNPTVYPGYSAHEELELMVECGLQPATALIAATTGAASFLNQSSSLGRIAPGFEADFVILERNPLENILNTRTIQFVVTDGVVVDDVVSISESDSETRLN